MDTASQVVREFFDRYARSRNSFDAEHIDSQYCDAFMFAGPDGARVVEKRTILAGLSKGREMFKTLGHQSTTLVSLQETTLDEHYAMVRARFVWRFEKSTAAPIDVEVDSTFILYIKDGVATIVLQHEHEEFGHALRARGVLPSTS